MKKRLYRAITRGLACGALAALSLSHAGALSAQTTQPSYTWNNVRIVAGGYVDGIIAHPKQQGLFYARTDVGGAYRWDSSQNKWIALNDWTPSADQLWTGVESLAIDPNNTNMLYLVTGLYVKSWAGNGAVLVSSDQGKSFTAYPLSFRVGGNEDGRNVGERLQVDPNDGSVLFYGTSNASYNNPSGGPQQVAGKDGLWTSKDKGATWSQVSGFTALTNDGTGDGVTFIAFAPAGEATGTPTKTIYAGVSTATAATNGTTLYVSTDAGVTWSPVPGGPGNELPQRGELGPDGNLYITYGNSKDSNGNYTYAVGPNGLNMGAVWKYDTVNHVWADITPHDPFNYASGYSGVSVDPAHPGTVVVMTMDHWYPMDTLWRTTDGGNSWVDVGGATWNGATPTSGTYAIRDASMSPWMIPPGKTQPGFGNWGEVVIDPFNSAHVMYGWGGGIWTTYDLTDADAGKPTYWSVGASGIEETAVLTLVSPTSGAHLISGLGDVCGFVHTSLTAAPPQQGVPLCNGGDGNGNGIDYGKNAPSTIVRVGAGGDNTLGTLSHDGGSTWTPFASKAGSTNGGGTVAISGDGKTIVWAPSDIAPVVSNDNGASWTKASGSSLASLPIGVQVLSDGYSPNVFYALDEANGIFYNSTNKGVSWQAVNTSLPKVYPSYQHSQATAVTGIPGEAKAGDVWIATATGLFRSTNYGATWNQVDAAAITAAASVGFGKAVTGSHYPTVYLSGTVNGVTGVFRSTNTGTTWVQINDTLHQWGGAGIVVGDPRTFGTVYIGPDEARGIIYGTSAN
ncbi:hypothetical protein [Dyella sp.]|uniref:sialidase family protein n=1 Tax=Dyella sp. TaxID=1869338 RepID=UPI002B46D173|nr:hypothetical protein [Dyella sp.]HKT27059.1 hypothetical protein [Dyella sp.]